MIRWLKAAIQPLLDEWDYRNCKAGQQNLNPSHPDYTEVCLRLYCHEYRRAGYR